MAGVAGEGNGRAWAAEREPPRHGAAALEPKGQGARQPASVWEPRLRVHQHERAGRREVQPQDAMGSAGPRAASEGGAL